jgi:selenocysteine lyase/cysteine desulfurase
VVTSNARRFENWETNCATKIGLGVAVDYALEWGLPAIQQRVTTLADSLRTRLGKIRGVTVRDLGLQKCGIVTFTMEGKEPIAIRDLLNKQAINVWHSIPSAALLDMQQRKLSGVIRASVHYFNTEEEVERFCSAVNSLI